MASPVWSCTVGSGAAVVSGTACFDQVGKMLTITNSNGAIINWDRFSIKAGETTHFAQPSASSTVLNRVLHDPTAIYGTLSSNGRVWLVNPAGIMVGAGGRVDTAGFVASTLNISNENFLAGRQIFANDGNAQGIVNRGEIKTPSGGSVYLIGAKVTNEGIITTPQGETILAAGQTVSLIDSATPGVKVDITGAAGNATNLGTITAEAGRIGIAGVIVRNSGTLNASSLVSEGGRIFLKATKTAVLNSTSEIKADAGRNGKGGEVLVWSDEIAAIDGRISARGGANGGNGGFVETSAARVDIADATRVTTLAQHGAAGTWLIDPNDFTIAASSGNMTGAAVAAALGGGNFVIETATMGTSGGNGDIFVNDGVTWNSANSLSLLAERNITVSAPLQNTGGGAINFAAGWIPSSGTVAPGVSSGVGSIAANSAVSAGSLNWKAGAGITIAANLTAADSIDIIAGGNLVQNTGTLISNGSSAGTHDITLGGVDITLRTVQAQRNVILNASGNVNLLGLGAGGFIDDTYFIYNLPFAFNFFGTPYTQAYITTNGLITFGSSTTAYSDSLAGLGAYRAIAPAWNDWTLEASSGRDIRIGFGGGVMTVLWDVGRYPSTTPAARFEAVLNPSGAIRFDYGTATTPGSDVTIGISNGTGSAIASQLMSLPGYASTSIGNLVSTTFTPNGSGGYTETLSASNTPLATPGLVSGSDILGQGTGVVVSAAHGALQINAGGLIYAPSRLYAQTLQFVSHGGASFRGSNQFEAIAGSHNYGSGDVWITNEARPLTIYDLANDGGNLVVDNTGGIVVAGAMSAANELTMTAHSPITVSSGASITAGGNLTLIAFSSSLTSLTDVLDIAGAVSSTGANVMLTGGSGVHFAATSRVSAPAGRVAADSPYGPVTLDPGAQLSARDGITITSYGGAGTPYQPPDISPGESMQRLAVDLDTDAVPLLTFALPELGKEDKDRELLETFGVDENADRKKGRLKRLPQCS